MVLPRCWGGLWMAEIDLFQAALGLPEPWRVVGAEFSANRQRLDLYLDFPKGVRFACPRATLLPVRCMTPATRPGGTWTSSGTGPTCTPVCPGSPARPTGCARSRLCGRGPKAASRCCLSPADGDARRDAGQGR